MARGYDSGYGSRASELLLCGFGHCKAPVRWQLDSRENLDRLVATSQPGALVSGLNSRWKAQGDCLRRTSWPPPLGVQATRVLTDPGKRCLRGSAAAQSGRHPHQSRTSVRARQRDTGGVPCRA